MINIVTIRNLTDSDVEFGTRSIPPYGALHISAAEYFEYVASNDIGDLPVSVQSRNLGGKHVSIADFGAVGNGLADDTNAIQSAIDYVSDNGGGVVEFPVGVYLVSGVTVKSDVSLHGESRIGTILRSNSRLKNSIITIEGAKSAVKSMRIVVG